MRALCLVPEQWCGLVERLAEELGTEHVDSFVGLVPSYGIYNTFVGVQKARLLLTSALQDCAASIFDLLKTLRAINPPGALEHELLAVPKQVAQVFTFRETILREHRTRPYTVFVTTCTFDVLGVALCELGKELQVPVVHVEHGASVCLPQDAWFAREYPGDLVLANSERNEKWWHKTSPQTPVLVTGHPLWDGYVSLPLAERHHPPVILWACESGANAAQTAAYWASRDVPKRAWQAFLKALQRLNQPATLLLKYRTGDDILQTQQAEDVLQAQERWQRVETVVTSQNPAIQDLPNVDLVLCQDSNIGIEALHLGLPVISITREGSNLFGEKTAWVIESEDESVGDMADALEEAINVVLHTQHRDSTPAPFYNKGVDGQAMARVVQTIASVARSGLDGVFQRRDGVSDSARRHALSERAASGDLAPS